MKILIAGGGTGGHVYPGIALAKEFESRGNHVAFVGTKNHVEARIVPENGFQLYFIWISGFQRRITFKNLLFPIKLFVSLIQSFFIIKRFKPDVVIGTGGYVCGPVLYIAQLLNVKTVIQEQNSFPGVTTRLLNKKVDHVYIAFDDAKKYLTGAKSIFNFGNPVRKSNLNIDKEDCLKKLNLDDRLTFAVIGGSLGAKSINLAIQKLVKDEIFKDVNLIWQTGQLTYEQFRSDSNENILIAPFFSEMNQIYAVTDIIICRAGAMTLAEVQNGKIPSVIIPYKYATGNHQLHNAKSLSDNNAAILIDDNEELTGELRKVITRLLFDESLRVEMKENISLFAKPNSTTEIVDSIYTLVKS